MFIHIILYLFHLHPVIDCGDPGTPANSVRTGYCTLYGCEMSFACNEFFAMTGSPNRFCESDSQWSGVQPVCDCKFGNIIRSKLEIIVYRVHIVKLIIKYM